MQAIYPILATGMQGAEVADLQVALGRLGLYDRLHGIHQSIEEVRMVWSLE